MHPHLQEAPLSIRQQHRSLAIDSVERIMLYVVIGSHSRATEHRQLIRVGHRDPELATSTIEVPGDASQRGTTLHHLLHHLVSREGVEGIAEVYLKRDIGCCTCAHSMTKRLAATAYGND